MTKTRVPVGNEILELHHVKDLDALMDHMTPQEEADHKMPYYGKLWPASIALARWTWRNLDLWGKDVMDLGCGIGLTGIAAHKKGARVYFADYFSQAIEIAAINAKKNGCEGQEFGLLDWRNANFVRQFDCVLASDILYEERNHEPIWALLKRCVVPGGFAVISDPKRPPSQKFFEKAQNHSFMLEKWELSVQLPDLKLPIDIVKLSKGQK